MQNLRRNFERFCLRHRNWGIPNLMLVVAVGNLIVYLFSTIDPSNILYHVLSFDPQKILSGQIWRIFTYIFVPSGDNILLVFILLFFYFQIGRLLESHWGRFRFNLFYFTGILLTSAAALLLNSTATSYYLDMSLMLAFATLYPESQFLLFYIIPIKAKYLALVYLGYTAVIVIIGLFPYNLYPVFALLNYFLFFGSDILNLFGLSFRSKVKKATTAPPKSRETSNPNPNWADKYRSASGQKPYHHKCTICGRTDTDNPDLEFRYCSRCRGYHCYCMDHINNHPHMQ